MHLHKNLYDLQKKNNFHISSLISRELHINTLINFLGLIMHIFSNKLPRIMTNVVRDRRKGAEKGIGKLDNRQRQWESC
jgi:hypothetical protein